MDQISDIIYNRKPNKVYVLELKPNDSIKDDWDSYKKHFEMFIDKLKKYNYGNVNIDFKDQNIDREHINSIFITFEIIENK